MSTTKWIDTDEYPLDHEPIEDWQRVDGSAAAGDEDSAARGEPTTAFAQLGTIAGADYGLWEMKAGTMRDVEGEEVFLVIRGTGRIDFDEPALAPIELAPGSLVRLEDGMKTRWYVDEAPLRKLFIAPSD
ncbi:hypothetical protein BSP239C_02568 [Brevibacterium sp. 239c]|uniref:cupin domain-containing protein n=1 Tax=Brevibacterium sp. 239c TaxID=1965356 RepID=UPI000C4310A6|nr:cupin domain-containing protein [Brevibacterium sp. 239c]SMX94719.1 hypothetical protein BSP239C_02568 [Brevibacterium sp. 239c]